MREGMMENLEIAQRVRAATRDLNRALQDANNAGLIVELRQHGVVAIGKPELISLDVEVSQPL